MLSGRNVVVLKKSQPPRSANEGPVNREGRRSYRLTRPGNVRLYLEIKCSAIGALFGWGRFSTAIIQQIAIEQSCVRQASLWSFRGIPTLGPSLPRSGLLSESTGQVLQQGIPPPKTRLMPDIMPVRKSRCRLGMTMILEIS